MESEAIRIRSLGELIDRITPDTPDPVTGRRRDSGVYRGVGDARWPMLTSLDRLGGVSPPHTKRGLEEHILRNFVRYSRPYAPPDLRNDWELLTMAQHHGVPTRLLDWTYSPFVAAHFATLGRRPDRPADREAREHGVEPPPSGDAQGDGPGAAGGERVIWRLDWQAVHRRFHLPELALLSSDLERLRGGSDFSPWELMAEPDDAEPFACLFEPPTLDARIAAQSAVFTVASDVSKPFDAFLAEHGLTDALTCFVIPVADVERVRDQLDLVTIDERRLFPDLDGVATRLRRYYS